MSSSNRSGQSPSTGSAPENAPVALSQPASAFPIVLVLEPELPWGRGEGVLARMHQVPICPACRSLFCHTGWTAPG
jgi:hypothetical protein